MTQRSDTRRNAMPLRPFQFRAPSPQMAAMAAGVAGRQASRFPRRGFAATPEQRAGPYTNRCAGGCPLGTACKCVWRPAINSWDCWCAQVVIESAAPAGPTPNPHLGSLGDVVRRSPIARDMMRRVQAAQMRRLPRQPSISVAPTAQLCNSDVDCPTGYTCRCGTGPSGETVCFCMPLPT